MQRHINTIERSGRIFSFKSARQDGAVSVLSLEPPDTHYLSAAQGWIGLGNWSEAAAELDKIRPIMRAHPDVLEIKYRLCAIADKWTEAMLICRTLTHLAPDRPFGWLNFSVALNKLDRTREAYNMLLPVLERFPNDSLIRYALARYACRQGLQKEASVWLHRAFDLGDPFQMMTAALNDPGLQPLWAELGVPTSAPTP